MIFLEKKIEDSTVNKTQDRKQRSHPHNMKTYYKHICVGNMQFMGILTMHIYTYSQQASLRYT